LTLPLKLQLSSNDEERLIEPTERVLDLVAYWNRLGSDERLGKSKKAEVVTFEFMYKARVFLPITPKDTAATEMMYMQVRKKKSARGYEIEMVLVFRKRLLIFALFFSKYPDEDT
jgi:hypothetical protein